jgi:hypothetical protein
MKRLQKIFDKYDKQIELISKYLKLKKEDYLKLLVKDKEMFRLHFYNGFDLNKIYKVIY